MQVVLKSRNRIMVLIFAVVLGFLSNIILSYAKDGSKENDKSLPIYERFEWIDSNYPIQIIKSEEYYSCDNYVNYLNVEVSTNKDNKKYTTKLYDQNGNIIHEKNFRADQSSKVIKYAQKENENPGDIFTLTIIDDKNIERVIRTYKVRARPKFVDDYTIRFHKDFKFAQGEEKIFLKNFSQLPKDTKVKIDEIDYEKGEINLSVILPDRLKPIKKTYKFYTTVNAHIAIGKTNPYIDKKFSKYTKFIFKAYEDSTPENERYGEIIDGTLDTFLVDFNKLSKEILPSLYQKHPEVVVKPGYKIIGWVRKEIIKNKEYHYIPKYAKIGSDEDKKTYKKVKIKFTAPEGFELIGQSEFEIPKGFSLYNMGYKLPKIVNKEGKILDTWGLYLDENFNHYQNKTYTAKIKEGLGATNRPVITENESIDYNENLKAKDLITNKESLPEDTSIEWSAQPEISEDGNLKGKLIVKYSDGSIVEVEINKKINKKQKDPEEKPGGEGKDPEKEESKEEIEEDSEEEETEAGKDSEEKEKDPEEKLDEEKTESEKETPEEEDKGSEKDLEEKPYEEETEPEKETPEEEDKGSEKDPEEKPYEEKTESEKEEQKEDKKSEEYLGDETKEDKVENTDEDIQTSKKDEEDLEVIIKDSKEKNKEESKKTPIESNKEKTKIVDLSKDSNQGKIDKDYEVKKEDNLYKYYLDFLNKNEYTIRYEYFNETIEKNEYSDSTNIDKRIVKIIKAYIEKIRYKIDGIEYIKKYMPSSYKKYKNVIDQSLEKAKKSIKKAEEFIKIKIV